jgi:hypothetical protein
VLWDRKTSIEAVSLEDKFWGHVTGDKQVKNHSSHRTRINKRLINLGILVETHGGRISLRLPN